MTAKKPPEGSDFTETTVSSTLAYDGGFLRLRRDSVRLCDGNIAWREYVEHPGAVMMLAFLDPETILLERQYRYPMHRHYLELPAGKIEANEPHLATAKRELVEECGYEAAEWKHLASLHTCIGYANEVIELYLARDLTHVGTQLDEGEHLETFPVRIEDALSWVRDGIITDTKTTFSLLWWDKWGNR
ncbi:NUDIX domain-containing protein [Usitatibacter palustris]|uniref:GDP-mannose pyrophosphatase n=1 Tax=Usitatibacter palustris TaxID=2732487 RepID=A0A6M4H918_9PROT|nr:NUDIX hydrolase [Usitatibacter palustris]QJR16070.1 Methanol dehydrogenase activator [Usitatibacter palustris]